MRLLVPKTAKRWATLFVLVGIASLSIPRSAPPEVAHVTAQKINAVEAVHFVPRLPVITLSIIPSVVPVATPPAPIALPAPKKITVNKAPAFKKVLPAPKVILPAFSGGSIEAIIVAAAQRHGVNPSWMLKIARCESGLNPHAINPRGPYEGLFQFSPRTYAGNGGHNIWDPVEQSEITATMLSHGQAHQWSCA